MTARRRAAYRPAMAQDLSVSVRPAVPGDEAVMHDLHTRSVRELCAGHYAAGIIDVWLEGRTPDGYRPAIDRGEMVMAEAGGEAAGFGHAVPGEVVACFVDPAYARRGVGRALFEATMEMARKDWSGPVRLEATLNAVAFYERLGFRRERDGIAVRNGVEIPTVHMIEEAASA